MAYYGYVLLQLLDAPNPHMLSKKEVQIYYEQTNFGEVLVDQGILRINVPLLLCQDTDVTIYVLLVLSMLVASWN